MPRHDQQVWAHRKRPATGQSPADPCPLQHHSLLLCCFLLILSFSPLICFAAKKKYHYYKRVSASCFFNILSAIAGEKNEQKQSNSEQWGRAGKQ